LFAPWKIARCSACLRPSLAGPSCVPLSVASVLRQPDGEIKPPPGSDGGGEDGPAGRALGVTGAELAWSLPAPFVPVTRQVICLPTSSGVSV
jgi:hypothetical protein